MAERVKHQTVFGRLLGRVALIEKHEMPAVIAAFLLFFFVLGGYFCVRPVRETVGTILGRDRVAHLYLWTWVGSIVIIPLFGWLVARLKRSVFLPLIYGFVAASLVAIGIVLRVNEGSIAVGQFFYVFISILSLFLTSVFWAFLLELFDSGQAKRLFGVIAAGGTAGALAGPGITFLGASTLGNAGILFVGATMFVAAIICQQALLRIWRARRTEHEEDRPIGGNPFAGFWLVLRSPYLLAIALFVVLLASANTFMYFEQLRLVKATFADTHERTRVFAALDWIVQGLTFVCQLFLTGRIASRLGLTVLLAIVPVAMIFGFLSFALVGTFAVLAVVIVARRVGEYAFVRPGREILFSRVDNETKYKAKNVIDVPVYRASDAITAQVSTALEGGTLGVTTVALIGAVVSAAWAINGWWLGRTSDNRSGPTRRG
jgi:AAA family ATP:ADP antiporter